MSDFYRQPGMMSIPDTGLGQIAGALQDLSPTLNTFIGKQADAANEAQMTQGQIDAERLDAEQAREVSRGNFVKLEKDGVIPAGASPFRLAAMQQTVGKKAVEAELRDVLNQNIQRFSDPYNEEDPAAFVQEQFVEMTQGMGFYAQAAATDALDAVERNFLNRTSLLRAEKTVRQNQEDLTSSGYQIFHADYDGIEFPVAEMTKRLQETADEHYKNTGESGRDQLLQSVQAAAMAAARDGDIEAAEDYIAAFRDVVIQGNRLGESMDDPLDALSDRANEAAERAGKREDEELKDRATRFRLMASEAQLEIYNKLTLSELRNTDPEELKKMATDILVNEGLSQEDAQTASSIAVQELVRLSKTGEMSRESRAEYTRALISRHLTMAERLEILNDIPDLPAELHSSGIQFIAREEDTDRNKAAIQNDSRIRKSFLSSAGQINTVGIGKGFGPEALFDLDRRFEEEVNRIIEEEAQGPGDDSAKVDSALERIKELTDSYRNNIQEISEVISEDAPPAVVEATQREREIQLGESTPPSVFDQKNSWWDSAFANDYMVLQDTESDKDSVRKARNRIYQNSLERREEILEIQSRAGTTRPGKLPGRELTDDERGEYARIGRVIGFTLDEIRSKQVLGLDIPPESFSPKNAILVPDMKSEEDLKTLYESDGGIERIIEIMEALPPLYRTGTDEEDVRNFVSLQRKLLKRYRPNNQVGDS